MRIWLILSIALVVQQTYAQVTFGPNGLQMSPINIVAFFNFLRKGWKKFMQSESSRSTKTLSYDFLNVNCLKNSTCEGKRIEEMAKTPNNTLNEKILLRLKSKKSDGDFFSLKNDEEEEGRFNPMLFPSPGLRSVLWIRFYYTFFLIIMGFVIFFSAPYFFTGMILQELKEGAEAEEFANTNTSSYMSYGDMEMMLNNTMNETITMENDMEECIDMEQMHTMQQTNDMDTMNQIRDTVMNKSEGAYQGNITSQRYPISQHNSFEQMHTVQQKNGMGLLDDLNIKNAISETEGIYHGNIMGQRQFIHTIQPGNIIMNHMQLINKMDPTKRTYQNDRLADRHQILQQNGLKQWRVVDQVKDRNQLGDMAVHEKIYNIIMQRNEDVQMNGNEHQHGLERMYYESQFGGMNHYVGLRKMNNVGNSNVLRHQISMEPTSRIDSASDRTHTNRNNDMNDFQPKSSKRGNSNIAENIDMVHVNGITGKGHMNDVDSINNRKQTKGIGNAKDNVVQMNGMEQIHYSTQKNKRVKLKCQRGKNSTSTSQMNNTRLSNSHTNEIGKMYIYNGSVENINSTRIRNDSNALIKSKEQGSGMSHTNGIDPMKEINQTNSNMSLNGIHHTSVIMQTNSARDRANASEGDNTLLNSIEQENNTIHFKPMKAMSEMNDVRQSSVYDQINGTTAKMKGTKLWNSNETLIVTNKVNDHTYLNSIQQRVVYEQTNGSANSTNTLISANNGNTSANGKRIMNDTETVNAMAKLKYLSQVNGMIPTYRINVMNYTDAKIDKWRNKAQIEGAERIVSTSSPQYIPQNSNDSLNINNMNSSSQIIQKVELVGMGVIYNWSRVNKIKQTNQMKSMEELKILV